MDSDTLSIIALVISILSLFLGLVSIYLTKRIEIVYEKFNKLCLSNVERILSNLDRIFEERSEEQMEHFRQPVTDTLVELQLFLVELKGIYPRIDLNSVDTISSKFSDTIYLDIGKLKVSNFKSNYFSAKLSILNKLYEFAIRKELISWLGLRGI